ncbi:hypothetical protein ABPG72_012423 [Tetrahymena utriculariae]
MCLGYIGRSLAQRMIRQELFVITLQNCFQGAYHKIVRQNNILQNEKINLNEKDLDFNEGNIEEKQIIDMVFIPSIPTKPCENVLRYCNPQITKEVLDSDQEKFKLEHIKSSQQIQTDQLQELQQYGQLNSITNRSEINSKQVKQIQKNQNNSLKEKLRLLNTKECNFIEINSLITSSQAMYIQNQKAQNQNQIQSNQQNIITNIKFQTIKLPTKEEQNMDKLSKLNNNKLLSSKKTDILFKFRIRRGSKYKAKIGLNTKTKQLIEEQIDIVLIFQIFMSKSYF